MAKFVAGKPLSTTVPSISVDAGLLPVGVHRFRLEVVGASGLASAAREVLVQVVAGTRVPDLPDRAVAAAPTPIKASKATKATRKPRSKT